MNSSSTSRCKAPDGSTCIDIRGLRYAAAGSGSAPAAPARWRPAHAGARDRVATVGRTRRLRTRRPIRRARSRFSGRTTPPALSAIGSPRPATCRPASGRHGVSSTSPIPGRWTPLRPTSTARSVCRRKWPISSAGWPSRMTTTRPRCGSSLAASARPPPTRQCARAVFGDLPGSSGPSSPSCGAASWTSRLGATSVITRRRCPRCCGRRPSPSWRCATANSSRP